VGGGGGGEVISDQTRMRPEEFVTIAPRNTRYN